MNSQFFRAHGLAIAASAALLGTVLTASCAGQGVKSSSSTACGSDFATPNYNLESDPSTSTPNLILRWNKRPLRVAFTDAYLYTFNGTTFNTSDVVKSGAQKWTDATGGEVRFTYPEDGSSPDIIVRVVQTPTQPGAGQNLGITTVTYAVSSKIIQSVDMTLYVWPGMTLAQLRDGFRTTAGHEFGHALFLTGHSTDANDLMYWVGNIDTEKFPSQRDRNSLATAYCGVFAPSAPSRMPLDADLKTITVSCPAH